MDPGIRRKRSERARRLSGNFVSVAGAHLGQTIGVEIF